MKESTSQAKNRRDFLRKLMAGTAATLALPTLTLAEGETLPEVSPPTNPDDEGYWEMVKRQFAVPDNLIMMNAANLCPAPYAITQSVQATLADLGKDVSFQFRDKFDALRASAIEKLAAYLGVDKNEVGITRNTTESNNIIVNGLDFKAGDEVILWDQNHPSNNVAWEYRAKRLGFTVKKISLPAAPKSADELIQSFQKAITPKTRLISFSHISNVSGIALPVKELCAMARSRNILTMVDGAQSFGFCDLNLRELGCDFYSGSTHKWLMGPLENGVVYIRRESMDRIWPLIISAGWNETHTTVDERYCIVGQRNESTPAAIPGIIDYHGVIGKRNIENRVRALNAHLKDQLRAKVPQATFITPLSAELSAGITIFTIPGKPSADIYQALYTKYGIAGAATMGVRLSPNIYNTKEDINKAVEAVRALAG